MTVAGRVFNNWTTQNLGEMSLHQALVVSCDTVFYQIAYQMWLTDNQHADVVANPQAPVQEMQQMELAWGFGRNTGIDLPEQSTRQRADPQWLYTCGAQRPQASSGAQRQANGSYVQQIEYENCQSGFVWEPGQAAIASIGQGYVTVTPLQLARRVRRAGQRGHAVQPADRRGAPEPRRAGWWRGSTRRSQVTCRCPGAPWPTSGTRWSPW